jgi:hypothetical protein
MISRIKLEHMYILTVLHGRLDLGGQAAKSWDVGYASNYNIVLICYIQQAQTLQQFWVSYMLNVFSTNLVPAPSFGTIQRCIGARENFLGPIAGAKGGNADRQRDGNARIAVIELGLFDHGA